VTFEEATTLESGDVELVWIEQSTPSLDVPSRFRLVVPIFDGDDPVEIEARFRYDIVEGRLAVSYSLVRVDEIVRAAFDATLDAISDSVGGPTVWRGRREG
jgi:hypothetical protein